MLHRYVPFAPVLLGVACAQSALGVMTALIPLLLLRMGESAGSVGLIASAYFVGFLGGALSADRIVSRVGHVRAFAVFAAGAADAGLLLVFCGAGWQVAGLRLVIGYAASGMFLVAESWLNERADGASRGRILAAYLVASWGAAAAGPLALNLVRPSPLLFVAVGFAFASAVIPMALTVQPNPEIPRHRHMGLVQLFAVSPVGAACALASGLVNSAFYGLSPVYLQRVGYGAGQIAAFVSATMLAGLVVQVPVGIASDRFGRRPVTVAILLGSCAAALALVLGGQPPFPALVAIGFLYACCTAPLYGLGAGQTNDRLQRGDYVAASGALLFTWSLGSSVGAGLAGAGMEAVGPVGLLLYLLTVLGVTALFTFSRILSRPAPAGEATRAAIPSLLVPARSLLFANRVMHVLRHPGRAAPTLGGLLHRPPVQPP